MQDIVLDQDLAEKLRGADAEVPLRDPSGQTVGYFVPAASYEREIYESAKKHISDEEIDRRMQVPGRRTTTEVLKRLQDE